MAVDDARLFSKGCLMKTSDELANEIREDLKWRCQVEGCDWDDMGGIRRCGRFQSDAPACDSCGAITVRNGNCYLCHNCGQSMGCS